MLFYDKSSKINTCVLRKHGIKVLYQLVWTQKKRS